MFLPYLWNESKYVSVKITVSVTLNLLLHGGDNNLWKNGILSKLEPTVHVQKLVS